MQLLLYFEDITEENAKRILIHYGFRKRLTSSNVRLYEPETVEVWEVYTLPYLSENIRRDFEDGPALRAYLVNVVDFVMCHPAILNEHYGRE